MIKKLVLVLVQVLVPVLATRRPDWENTSEVWPMTVLKHWCSCCFFFSKLNVAFWDFLLLFHHSATFSLSIASQSNIIVFLSFLFDWRLPLYSLFCLLLFIDSYQSLFHDLKVLTHGERSSLLFNLHFVPFFENGLFECCKDLSSQKLVRPERREMETNQQQISTTKQQQYRIARGLKGKIVIDNVYWMDYSSKWPKPNHWRAFSKWVNSALLHWIQLIIFNFS